MKGEETARNSKDLFLFEALYQADGFDGELTGQTFYDFIIGRYGVCPYTLKEVEDWLNGTADMEALLQAIAKGKEDNASQQPKSKG